MARAPRIVVFSSLWPSPAQPAAGIFVRERMFRVAKRLPLVVVSPAPWFPFQALLRWWRPHFRPATPRHEVQGGIEIFRPRFLSVPGLLKRFDGVLMALGARGTLVQLRRDDRLDVLDAHFGYPDGYAATLLGKWLRVPATITLRGTESRHARTAPIRRRLTIAFARASRIFAVAGALKDVAVALGVSGEKVAVVGNGVDVDKFRPLPIEEARRELGLAAEAKVLISVGGLTERKGFHRVIDCLPALREQFPDVLLLVVGGPGPEGDWGARLRAQVATLGLGRSVHFLGALPAEQLRVPLSASDAFVLATSNEGWANVFLEAMACGLPVVTTRVGGNAEVVSRPDLGVLVPFGDQQALTVALREALQRTWDRAAIRAYAEANAWDGRIEVLVAEFSRLAPAPAFEPVAATDANRA